MARIQIGDGLSNYGWIGDFYNWDLSIQSSSDTQVVFEDSSGSIGIVHGTDLVLDGTAFTAGKVTGVEFISGNGDALITVTESNYKAKSINSHNLWEFLTKLTAGDDQIIGSNFGSDLHIGDNRGDDRIIAGADGSYMAGSEGRDVYKGGAGWDTLSYRDAYGQNGAKRGVVIDAAKGVATDPWGDKDKFSGVEEYQGSLRTDTMTGSKNDDMFMGVAGKDVIDGGKGWDTVRYHRDERYGGEHGIVADLSKGRIVDGFGDADKVTGIEAVFGTYFDDVFKGDGKDNQFRGLSGVDSFDGGKGTDEVSFEWGEDLGQHGVKVDLTLASGQIIDDGFGNTEQAIRIEAITGSDFGDEIRLGASKGWVDGRGGADRLTAGAKENIMTGGSGADTFVFLSAADSLKGTVERDFITDFSHAEGDRIDLSAFGGISFAGNISVSVNSDGNTIVTVDLAGESDLQFLLKGNIDLEASDFIFA